MPEPELSATPSSPSRPPKKTNNTVMYVIAVIVILCCCCFGILGLIIAFLPSILSELGLA